MKTRRTTARGPSNLPVVLTMLAVAAACGDSPTIGNDPFTDYEDEATTVIGGSGDNRILVEIGGQEGECVQVSDSLCVPVDTSGQWCESEGGPVDVIMVDGEVVEVICYPADDSQGPSEVVDTTQQGDIEVVQTANQTAITFADDTNGVPIEGNIDIQGNGVSVFGNGPDNTIINGDVIVSGNNIRLRGLTVTGSIYVNLNNVAIVLCRVLGDIVLQGFATNESVIAENDVFGAVTINSNSNTIVGNDVQGAWTVSGHNNTCDSNQAFSDANADQLVQDSERSGALGCSQ